MSPTQRTLRELKNQGRICAVVEKWQIIPGHTGGGIRRDLFGIIDIIALDPKTGVVGVQACGSDFAAHWRKITVDKAQETTDWLSTPGTSLELYAWRKVKVKRGGKAMIWQPRIVEITLDDLFDDGWTSKDGD